MRGKQHIFREKAFVVKHVVVKFGTMKESFIYIVFAPALGKTFSLQFQSCASVSFNLGLNNILSNWDSLNETRGLGCEYEFGFESFVWRDEKKNLLKEGERSHNFSNIPIQKVTWWSFQRNRSNCKCKFRVTFLFQLFHISPLKLEHFPSFLIAHHQVVQRWTF